MYAAGAGEQLAELTSLLETQGWQVLGSESLASGMEAVLTALGLVQLLVAVGMYTLFIYYGGSTPGMLISGIRVTRVDGADVSFAVAFLRGTVFWLFIFFTMGLYLLVGALYTFLDPRGRAIHDVLTDTNVYLRNSSS